jgi:alkanesulfonate monooxygenase SsuD/methylene tetrahydromethanopterin reductase-like flavin-dependent oxidoreductase (luciferase family)
MAPLPIGVALGTIGLSGDAWLRAASQLAVAPIDRLWIWDHLMGRGAPERPVLEAITMAAAALAQHQHLRVGTLVLDVTKRHPALTAKVAATLDAIAPGRFTLGIGAGGDPMEHEALGMAYGEIADRISVLTTQVAVAKALLHGDPTERVTLAGSAPLRNAASAPRPGARVQILIAGDHPSSIRLAASAADEWVAPVDRFDVGLQQLRDCEREQRRAGQPVRALLLHELSAAQSFAATPFGQDPAGSAARAAAMGADGIIITVRTERDVDDAVTAITKLG